MRNVRMIHEAIPSYQIAKRARLDQLAHEAETKKDHSLEIAACLLVFGVLLTAVLIAASITFGLWEMHP